MGLDEKKTQHAGLAFDVNSSLISIEATGGPTQALQAAARRIRRLVRFSDSVLLLEHACALLLPETPFSGAQALANRISAFLGDVPYTLQVYHGATALLVLQHLHEANARVVPLQEENELPTRINPAVARTEPHAERRGSTEALPYLAFLANYPSPRLLHLFPYELACRYQCVPLGSERTVLTLATWHWLDRETVGQLRTATRWDFFQVRCELSIIDEVLRYWRQIQETSEREELIMDKTYSSSSR